MTPVAVFAHHFTSNHHPPLGGDLDLKEAFAVVAAALALIAYITTVRLWMNKALLDTRDAINKDGATLAKETHPNAKGILEVHVANLMKRHAKLKDQLYWLRYADVLAILGGVIALTFPFVEWLPLRNWTFTWGTWSPAVIAYQLILLATIALGSIYFIYQIRIEPSESSLAEVPEPLCKDPQLN